jgi:DNA-binding LytR/AlgR family response regulator
MKQVLVKMNDIVFSFLILEDEPIFRADLKQIIQGMPFKSQIYTSTTIAEALDIADQRSVDAFLVDIDLPEEKNGMDFIRSINSMYPTQTPIIIVSARLEVHFKLEAFRLRALAFIDKPYQEEQVIAELQEAVQVAKMLGLNAVTFMRKNDEIEYQERDIIAIGRVPGNQKRIIVIAYDPDARKVTNEEFPFRRSLIKVLDLFEKKSKFVQCHQSWLFNPRMYKGRDKVNEEIKLRFGLTIPYTRKYEEKILGLIVESKEN